MRHQEEQPEIRGLIHRVLPIISSYLIVLFLYQASFLVGVDNTIHDTEALLTRSHVHSDLVLVDIDHSSLKQFDNWPWPRSHYATVLDKLGEAGAKSVFFDIDFSTQSAPAEDLALLDSIKRMTSGSVMMASFMQHNVANGHQYIDLSMPIDIFTGSVIPVSVNLQPGKDGLVRQMSLHTVFADTQLPTAAVINNQYVTTPGEQLRLNYRINPSSFKRISFFDIYNDDYDTGNITGKHVIIGATALELGDTIPVPVYNSLPGPVVQAIAYQTLATGNALELSSKATSLLLLLLCIPAWLMFSYSRWTTGLRRLFYAATITLAVSFYLHVNYYFILHTTAILLLFTLSFITLLISQFDAQSYKLITQKISLRNKDKILGEIIENANEGVIILDSDLHIRQLNQTAKNILNIKNNKFYNLTAQCFLSDASLVHNLSKTKGRIETSIKLKQNSTIPVELSITKISLENNTLYVLFLHDITERLAKREKLVYDATHDQLTALYNRAHLLAELDNAINNYNEHGATATVLLIDLNNFKDINDTLGHETGDQLLNELGSRFTSLQTTHTCIARLGGDEFCIIEKQSLDEKQLEKYVDNINRLINEPVHLGGMSLTIDSAIGVASIPQHATTAGDIMKVADMAMYMSKQHRRSYTVYEEASRQNSIRKLTISNDLKTALLNEQFEMHYQPQVDFQTSKVISLEALIRWHHPTMGKIYPDEFIPFVENSTLIKPITMFTIRSAAKLLKTLHAQDHDIKIAINISAKLLEDQNLAYDIQQLLKSLDTPAHWFILEITEGVAVHSKKQAVDLLNELQNQGFDISIDDFGTCYSSFEYLKQLPTTELKIDKLFISKILENESDRIISSSILELAHSLNLRVVVEGIEDVETYNYLRDSGFDIAQGYWISIPIQGKDVLTWLDSWHIKPQLIDMKSNPGDQIYQSLQP